MATELEILGQDDPIYASTVNGYDEATLASLVGYIDQTIAWMQGFGMHAVESEDVVALRVGVPYLGTDQTVDAATVYTNDGNIDTLITTLGVDAVKFTAKDTTPGIAVEKQLISYTYKSPYIHQIFGSGFIDGVTNLTGYTYLDGFDVSLSKLASMPVQYDGVVQNLPIIPEELPTYVISCIQYIIQNPKLIGSVIPDIGGGPVITGDMMYFTTNQFFTGLVRAKFNAERQFNTVSEIELPLTTEAAIKEILETIGMDDAFNDLDYGGLIEGMRLTLRIPASRENQVVMQGLLGNGEEFNDVFKEEWVPLFEKDITESVKKEHQDDPYSTDVTSEQTVGTIVLLDDVSNGFYGCKGAQVETDPVEDPPAFVAGQYYYRYWTISDTWLRETTPERAAIVFWMGIDLVSAFDTDPCPYDEIITIVIIVAVTIATWGAASGAVAKTLLVLSAIVSIGTTIGLISPKTAKKLGIAIAVLSLGTSLASSSMTLGLNMETLSLVIQTGQIGLQIAEMDLANDIEDIEELEERTEKEKEESKLLEDSGIVIELGGTADMHLSNWPTYNYNKPYETAFDKYSVFKERGFRNG